VERRDVDSVLGCDGDVVAERRGGEVVHGLGSAYGTTRGGGRKDGGSCC
jgi:hypothetical protein